MYQYLSWFHRGKDYPSGNKLTSLTNVNKLKASLLTSGVEVHESVQRYDELGRILYTPLYADFDGQDSTADVMKFINNVETEFKITPEIFFSGSRGYHVFINTPIHHEYPHLIAQKFMTIMSDSKYLDQQMYASRHLLRSEGSIHFKTNLFKTRITKDELADVELTKLKARKQSVSQRPLHSSPVLDMFIGGLKLIVSQEVKEADEKYKAIKLETGGDVPPCIRSLINNGPVPGNTNNILTLIARSFNSSGISLDDAIADVMSSPKWMAKHNEVVSVLKSTYKRPSRFGCKNNETLKQYCDQFCAFNEVNINIM